MPQKRDKFGKYFELSFKVAKPLERFLDSSFLYSTGSHLFIHIPLLRGDQHHLLRQSLLNFRSTGFVKQSTLDFHRFGTENCLGEVHIRVVRGEQQDLLSFSLFLQVQLASTYQHFPLSVSRSVILQLRAWQACFLPYLYIFTFVVVNLRSFKATQ